MAHGVWWGCRCCGRLVGAMRKPTTCSGTSRIMGNDLACSNAGKHWRQMEKGGKV